MNDGTTTGGPHPGALVHTRGGGPTMQVTAVIDMTDTSLVHCAWRDETNEVVVGSFRPDDLVVIVPPAQALGKLGGAGQTRAS